MASIISALSFFILVLSNGCFTLPINNEQLFNSSLNDLTTERTFSLRLISENETNMYLNMDKIHPLNEHIGFQISTPVDNLLKENVTRVLRTFDEILTSEGTITTEKYFNDKRNYDDLSLTTIESIIEHEQRGVKNEFETETDKRETEVELTTNDIFLFPTTSSDIIPTLYTSEPLTSTSTEKYIGLLSYEDDKKKTTKSAKNLKKTTPKTEVLSTTIPKDQSEEDSKELTPPTAVFDQEALKNITYVPNDFMILDENNTLVVTDLPDKISTSIIKNKNEQEPLKQGKESLHTEEKESNN